MKKGIYVIVAMLIVSIVISAIVIIGRTGINNSGIMSKGKEYSELKKKAYSYNSSTFSNFSENANTSNLSGNNESNISSDNITDDTFEKSISNISKAKGALYSVGYYDENGNEFQKSGALSPEEIDKIKSYFSSYNKDGFFVLNNDVAKLTDTSPGSGMIFFMFTDTEKKTGDTIKEKDKLIASIYIVCVGGKYFSYIIDSNENICYFDKSGDFSKYMCEKYNFPKTSEHEIVPENGATNKISDNNLAQTN